MVKGPVVTDARKKIDRLCGGVPTKIFKGGFPDSTKIASEGNLLYLKEIKKGDYGAALLHTHLISGLQRLKTKLSVEMPLNIILFSHENTILHHFYIQGDKCISTYRTISSLNKVELDSLFAYIATMGDAKALNLILNGTKKLTGQLKNKFDDQGKDFYIRNMNLKLDWVEKLNRLGTAMNSSLSMNTLTVADYLPKDANTAIMSGVPQNTIPEFIDLGDSLSKWFQEANRKLGTKHELIKELSEGQNDIILVFAHATKNTFYINNEELTLRELNDMQKRQVKTDKPRIIILVACMTGNNYQQQGLIFKKDIQSMAQILMDKNFADIVIAPDENILISDMKPLLQSLMSGQTLASVRKAGFKKWSHIVDNFPYLIKIKARFFYEHDEHPLPVNS